jgi:hypothetical protein
MSYLLSVRDYTVVLAGLHAIVPRPEGFFRIRYAPSVGTLATFLGSETPTGPWSNEK